MRWKSPFTVSLILVLSSGLVASARTWTDVTGRFSVEGNFERLHKGSVDIRRDDGKLVRIPLEKLSDPNQKLVEQLTRAAADESPFTVAEEERNAAVSTGGDGEAEDLHTVVVEGVGTTAETALKDAFRAAVQQVVGTVVDAETLVTNDELVRDQVLTYSDAFVPKHEKISERMADGLFRVSIRATVQRRNLIMKLKAANITVKEVDGQSMFGNIVSQLSAEEDAAAMLARALEGIPEDCIIAKIVGEPRLMDKDGSSAKIGLAVEFKTDKEAYNAAVVRLQRTLDAIAKTTGESTLLFEETEKPPFGDCYVPRGGNQNVFLEEVVASSFPKVLAEAKAKRGDFAEVRWDPRQLGVALAAHVSKAHDRFEWKYYSVDPGLLDVLSRPVFMKAECKVTLLDGSDNLIAVDRFNPLWGPSGYGMAWYPTVVKLLGDGSYEREDEVHFISESDKKLGRLIVVAPVFFSSSNPWHKPTLTIRRTIKLSHDEIKEIARAQCEIRFEE